MSALERTDLELLFLLDRWMIRRRAVESATAFARGLCPIATCTASTRSRRALR